MTDAVGIFRALGDLTRLRLVNLLLRANKSLCVCEMGNALQLPQYQISKHLTILRSAGLLQATREGTWVYYQLDREESPLLWDLSQVLSRHLYEDIFEEDARRLKTRLLLREEGKCVVGFVSEKELKKRIRQKGVEVE